MIKFCVVCGKPLSKKCKGDRCRHHRLWTGINNPFYGKKHNRTTIEEVKKKLSLISKKKWEDPLYREKVIKSVSKPRIHTFKKEQSIRIKKWYKDNPEQRKIRSKKMAQSWERGLIVPNNCMCTRSPSKIEAQFFHDVKDLSVDSVIKKSLKFKDQWVIPDVIIPELKIIFELYGDYWHAHPFEYLDENEIVHHGNTAKKIWERDEEREKNLIALGYSVYIIWESEYKENREKVLKFVDSVINWDSCSF